ncbi:lamin tail domain-containing protein, partial [Candidatus Roizmanbacteria bacterium]|nr:lamin tail domain-containing protein [Candidatus Roizmanbacteria bacterium]
MKYVFLLLGILFFSLLGHNTVADTTIRINEFFIEPTPQQVEIINTGTQSADISGWYIDDNGGSTYYTIPQSSILYPNACLVFAGDFNLNKSSPDTIRLFNTIAPPTSTNANLIDSFSYKLSSGSGISYLRLPDGTDNW